MPPVTRTVPSARNTAGPSGTSPPARTSRGTERAAPRTATCGSPPASTAPRTGTAPSPEAGSVSIRMIRSGFSACAARTRPQTADPAGSVTLPSPAGTAPRVTTTRRDSSSPVPASQAWTTSSTREVDSSTASSPSAPVTAWRTATAGTAALPARASTSSAPETAAHDGAGSAPSAGGSSVHSTPNSESRLSSPAAAPNWSVDTGRDTSESIVRTMPPVSSAAWNDSASGPHGATRTRSAEAPTACSTSPFHANGSTWRSSSGLAKAFVWRAASSSAGCMPNLPASSRCSSGRTASAKTSSPRRHTARRPWNAGPYA